MKEKRIYLLLSVFFLFIGGLLTSDTFGIIQMEKQDLFNLQRVFVVSTAYFFSIGISSQIRNIKKEIYTLFAFSLLILLYIVEIFGGESFNWILCIYLFVSIIAVYLIRLLVVFLKNKKG